MSSLPVHPAFEIPTPPPIPNPRFVEYRADGATRGRISMPGASSVVSAGAGEAQAGMARSASAKRRDTSREGERARIRGRYLFAPPPDPL